MRTSSVAQRVTTWDDRQGVLFLEMPAQPYASATAGGGAAGAAGSSSAPIVAIHAVQLLPGAGVGLQRRHAEPGLAAGAGGRRGRRARTRAADSRRHGVHHRRGGVAAAGGVHDGLAGQDRGAGCRAAGRGRRPWLRRLCPRQDSVGTDQSRRSADPNPLRHSAGLGGGDGDQRLHADDRTIGPTVQPVLAQRPGPRALPGPGSSTTTTSPALATTTRWPPPVRCPPAPIACTTTRSTTKIFRATSCRTTPTLPSRSRSRRPAGTVHEAFFDPVAIGAGVGADGSRGVLQPAAFSVGATGTTIERLVWEANEIRLELSAAIALADHYLDLIAAGWVRRSSAAPR